MNKSPTIECLLERALKSDVKITIEQIDSGLVAVCATPVNLAESFTAACPPTGAKIIEAITRATTAVLGSSGQIQ